MDSDLRPWSPALVQDGDERAEHRCLEVIPDERPRVRIERHAQTQPEHRTDTCDGLPARLAGSGFDVVQAALRQPASDSHPGEAEPRVLASGAQLHADAAAEVTRLTGGDALDGAPGDGTGTRRHAFSVRRGTSPARIRCRHTHSWRPASRDSRASTRVVRAARTDLAATRSFHWPRPRSRSGGPNGGRSQGVLDAASQGVDAPIRSGSPTVARRGRVTAPGRSREVVRAVAGTDRRRRPDRWEPTGPSAVAPGPSAGAPAGPCGRLDTIHPERVQSQSHLRREGSSSTMGQTDRERRFVAIAIRGDGTRVPVRLLPERRGTPSWPARGPRPRAYRPHYRLPVGVWGQAEIAPQGATDVEPPGPSPGTARVFVLAPWSGRGRAGSPQDSGPGSDRTQDPAGQDTGPGRAGAQDPQDREGQRR